MESRVLKPDAEPGNARVDVPQALRVFGVKHVVVCSVTVLRRVRENRQVLQPLDVHPGAVVSHHTDHLSTLAPYYRNHDLALAVTFGCRQRVVDELCDGVSQRVVPQNL